MRASVALVLLTAACAERPFEAPVALEDAEARVFADLQGCVGATVPGDYALLDDAIRAYANVGGTICLAAGTFTFPVNQTITRAITIQGVSATRTRFTDTVSLYSVTANQGVTIRGVGFERTVSLVGPFDLSLSTFHTTAGDALILRAIGSGTHTVRWSDVSAAHGYGVSVSGDLPVTLDAVDAQASDSAIYTNPYYTERLTVTNSYLHDSTEGVTIGGLSPLTLLHSAITRNNLGVNVELAGSVVANNAVVSNTTGIDGVAGVAVTRNAVWANTTNYRGVVAASSVTADPQLDMALAPPAPRAGSPLLAAADPAYAVSTDFAASPRANPATIGATERATEALNGLDDDGDGMCDEGLLQPGDLIINEVMVNPEVVTDANGEWFEVYNTTSHAITLCDGWTVADNAASHPIANDITIAARGYAVFARRSNTAQNNGVRVAYTYGTSLSLANTSDTVRLTFAGQVIDSVDLRTTNGWPSAARTTGASFALRTTQRTATLNDAGAAWCAGTASYGRLGGNGQYDKGTPGAVNTCN